MAEADTVKQHCQLTGTPAITWGGPLTAFRTDNLPDYDIKNASIRSIKPTNGYYQGPEGYYESRWAYSGKLGYI